jgi:hypothetical protein
MRASSAFSRNPFTGLELRRVTLHTAVIIAFLVTYTAVIIPPWSHPTHSDHNSSEDTYRGHKSSVESLYTAVII